MYQEAPDLSCIRVFFTGSQVPRLSVDAAGASLAGSVSLSRQHTEAAPAHLFGMSRPRVKLATRST